MYVVSQGLSFEPVSPGTHFVVKVADKPARPIKKGEEMLLDYGLVLRIACRNEAYVKGLISGKEEDAELRKRGRYVQPKRQRVINRVGLRPHQLWLARGRGQALMTMIRT
jgi:hypothetical protein